MNNLFKRLLCTTAAIVSASLLFVGSANAEPYSASPLASPNDEPYPTIPNALFENLEITRDASPKELYEAVTERYYDPAHGHGEGKYAEYWEPLPFSQYMDPDSYYTPPDMPAKVATREECIECHEDETLGWVVAWRKSVHANLDEIRQLPKDDPRYYKIELIENIERNLRSMGKLGENEKLKEVSCIDCHVGIGAEKGSHKEDLRLPDAATCGVCHLRQFAERESERDTITWPSTDAHGDKMEPAWPPGRPSHALDYQANVELATWAAMEERQIAEGCTICHINQNRCDTCHTRHQFSAAEARKPVACSYCHNGPDHNEWRHFKLSKHGAVLSAHGDSWNWEMPLEDAIKKNGQTGPTCAFCHMEYKGEFTHNVVRKVRWAFAPMKKIGANLGHEWYKKRKKAWVNTCTNCHSETFATSYLTFMDKGVISGIELMLEAKGVVEGLYEDGLLPGQATNRPEPPKPEHDGPGHFFQLFIVNGNNPTTVEATFARMWEQSLLRHYKSLAHMNPNGWTYASGWGDMTLQYTKIQTANTKLRAFANLKSQVAKLESKLKTASVLDLNGKVEQAAVGGLGGSMVLAGMGFLVAWRRKRQRKG